MKTGIAVVCFAVGCVGLASSLVWFAFVLVTRNQMWPFPSGIGTIETLFAVWGLVMFATFYRNPRPIWRPLLGVTTERIKIARLLLACAFMNCVVWFCACVALWAFQLRAPLGWMFCLLASATTMLNSLYVLIHWALRPENLFSERFRRFADDPIIFVLFEPIVRRRKLR